MDGQRRMRGAILAAGIMGALLFCLHSGEALSSGGVPLEWDGVAGAAGYRLYFGTASGIYTSHIDVGPVTAFLVDGLQNRSTYFFAATAFDASGQESGYSNEVSFTVPLVPLITTVSAMSGPEGTTLTIDGAYLDDAAVEVSGSASQVLSVNATELVALVPAGVESGQVTVATPGGSLTGSFTVASPESVLDLEAAAWGIATAETVGPQDNLNAGYAVVSSSGSMPQALALLAADGNEVAIGPSGSARAFAIYVDAGAETGMALVNTGSEPAHLSLTLTDSSGAALSTATLGIAPGGHVGKMVSEIFAVAGAGSIQVSSDQPVSLLALRLWCDDQGRILLGSVPWADLEAGSEYDPLYFPWIVSGGGYSSSLFLLNASADAEETGTIEFLDDTGAPIGGSLVPGRYDIPPGGVSHFAMADSSSDAVPGWILLTPDPGIPAPAAFGGFRLEAAGPSETVYPAASPSRNVLVFIDGEDGKDTVIATINPGAGPVSLAGNAYDPDGNVTYSGSWQLASGSRNIQSAGQLLPAGFTGTLELAGNGQFVALPLLVSGSGGASAIPLSDPDQVLTQQIFPQVADGGGYQTRLVSFGASSGSSASLGFFAADGSPLAIGLPK